MGLEAVGDMVIVKLYHKEKIGSIFLPDQTKNYNADFYGEVIKVGPKLTLDIQEGDKLAFNRHEGIPIEYEGEEYLSLKAMHILGKIEGWGND